MTTIKHLYIRIFLPLLGALLSLSLAQAAAPFVVFAPEEGCFTLAENGEMADKCSNGGTATIGGLKVLAREDMIAIYRMAK